MMKKKRLISSYDEINDTFVGKIDGKDGYCADFGISEGIFLTVDKDNMPSSVYVNNASCVFNTSKNVLENANVKISLDCDDVLLNFNMFIDDSKICSVTCENNCGMPKLNFLMDSNY